jgi:hypothetical protein
MQVMGIYSDERHIAWHEQDPSRHWPGQCIYMHIQMLPSLLVRICASLLSPAEMEAGREIGMIADDPERDTLTADPLSVWASIPLVHMRGSLVVSSFATSMISGRVPGHHYRVLIPCARCIGEQSLLSTVRRPSFQGVHILVQCSRHGVVDAQQRTRATYCPNCAQASRNDMRIQIIRIGDWFQDFELNKG